MTVILVSFSVQYFFQNGDIANSTIKITRVWCFGKEKKKEKKIKFKFKKLLCDGYHDLLLFRENTVKKFCDGFLVLGDIIFFFFFVRYIFRLCIRLCKKCISWWELFFKLRVSFLNATLACQKIIEDSVFYLYSYWLKRML